MTDERGGGPADVLYVLVLLQASFLVLGALGEQLLMGGNPAYLIVPVAKTALLITLAAKVGPTAGRPGRRWASVALMVVQGVTLTAFWLELAVGLTPWVDASPTLTGLITNVGLPAAIMYLAARAMWPRAAGRVVRP